MRKLLLVIAAIAGGVLARKLAARSNTQVHRINQSNQSNQRSER
jgi:hypothetical protein